MPDNYYSQVLPQLVGNQLKVRPNTMAADAALTQCSNSVLQLVVHARRQQCRLARREH